MAWPVPELAAGVEAGVLSDDDELPDDEVPDDEVPDDELPDDEVPDDEVPDDEPDDDEPDVFRGCAVAVRDEVAAEVVPAAPGRA